MPMSTMSCGPYIPKKRKENQKTETKTFKYDRVGPLSVFWLCTTVIIFKFFCLFFFVFHSFFFNYKQPKRLNLFPKVKPCPFANGHTGADNGRCPDTMATRERKNNQPTLFKAKTKKKSTVSAKIFFAESKNLKRDVPRVAVAFKTCWKKKRTHRNT